ncbi:MAG: hypothetical protein ACI97A_000966 [Planctomycetota bacterium]|jgi:hypothetical protein
MFNSLANGETPKYFKIRAEVSFQVAAELLNIALKEIRSRDELILKMKKDMESMSSQFDSCDEPEDASSLDEVMIHK